MAVKVAPSVLSCDFGHMADEMRAIEKAGADLVHIDVMDGHFVPNITIGPVVVKDIRRCTGLVLDVHLMIDTPATFAPAFIEAGSDMITVHQETISAGVFCDFARSLRNRGIKAGVSFRPATPVKDIIPYLSGADLVLVMSVNPGFGGQAFMPEVLPKIRALRAEFSGDISVDGGINEQTARLVCEAGANILVAGSYIFGSKEYARSIASLKGAQKAA
jgi:ribulose-phosphate 3-epimerase